MAIHAYLVFNGNCREALDFYVLAFGSQQPKVMTYGSAPANPDFQLPEAAKDLVMHAQMEIDGSSVMFSDTFPGMPHTVGTNVNLAIVSRDAEKLRSYFAKLKEGGQVVLELQQTDWSECYGKVIDKFGIEWQISHESGAAAG